MPVFSFEFVIEIEYLDPTNMAPVEEGYGHIRYYDERIDDLMILGTMHFSESLLPTEGGSYEVSMSWFDSPQNVSQTIGKEQSIVELRADFYGIKDESRANFVFRDPESTDYDSRKGIMDVYPEDGLPEEKSMDFLDWSKEFKLGPWQEVDVDHNRWPGGIPFESYYVTFEFERSPGALDNPPRKRNE